MCSSSRKVKARKAINWSSDIITDTWSWILWMITQLWCQAAPELPVVVCVLLEPFLTLQVDGHIPTVCRTVYVQTRSYSITAPAHQGFQQICCMHSHFAEWLGWFMQARCSRSFASRQSDTMWQAQPVLQAASYALLEPIPVQVVSVLRWTQGF